jgi:phosphate transport system substrate-binding protein
VSYSCLLLYKQYDDPHKAAALENYLRWCLIDGQEFNESLGFVRLPPRVVSHAVRAVAAFHSMRGG